MGSSVPTTALAPVSAGAQLVQRIIVLTIQVAGGQTLTLGSTTDANLCPRCSVHLDMVTIPATSNAVVVVYGLTLDHINQLTVAGLLYADRPGGDLLNAYILSGIC